ncbi:MAG: autotransporter-associated beta strand repeat-containing protein, partial [Verrucomicrobiota bacterium]
RVMGNSTIALDNKGETAGSGTDNNYGMGSLTIGGPYTLAVRGVASQDISFDGAAFAGTPTIDLPQVTNGTNTSTVTIANAISGSGFYVSSTGNVANTAAVLQLGNADAIANTYSGKLVMAGGGLNNQPTLQLNKAAGTTAVTGDVEVNSGLIQWMADEQMTDAGKLTLNFGTVDFNGKSETLAGVTMRGGVIRTNSAALAEVNTIVVNGDFEATGASLLNAVADGVQINSNSTLTITGTLRMSAYGKVVLGASAATLNVGALELAGNVITQSNGAGANVIRLAGDVTTSPASIPAGIGASNDSDTFLELNGSRTFTVADGHIGLDLSLSSVIRDSTIGLPAGGIIKNGPGIMQIQGGGTANSFTGPTVVNAGSVVLFKNSNVNSLGSGALTIGDGIGGTRADQVVIRNSEQINNDADVTVASSGLLDLASFDKSEQIGSLSGSGVVTLGPGSVLTVGGSTITDFSGQILGGGALTKSGPGTLVLSGMSDYLGSTSINEGILTVSGSISGSPVLVNSSGTLAGNGQLNQVTVGSGGTLSPGNTLGKLSTRELDLQSGSLLNIQLGGTLLGLGYDQVAVAGGITLAGDLSGSLINGFVPSANDIFYLLLNDGSDLVSGNFTGLAEGSIYTFDGIDFVITYAANGDGGTVANDVALIAPIPEPTAALNLLVAGCSLLGLRRFRRSSKSRR